MTAEKIARNLESNSETGDVKIIEHEQSAVESFLERRKWVDAGLATIRRSLEEGL